MSDPFHSDLLQLLKDNNPAKPFDPISAPPRLLSIKWASGGHMLFYYNYLMAAGRLPDEPPDTMALYFTSQTVRLNGIGLDELIKQFERGELSSIYVCNPRYITRQTDNEPIVTAASIEGK